MMTNKQIARAAEILDQIDALGRELRELVEIVPYNERKGFDNPIGATHYFASEQLGLDPEYFITPAMQAKSLRELIPAKAAA